MGKLHSLGLLLLEAIGKEFALPKDALTALAENTEGPSSSMLSLFEYAAAGACPEHVDYTLLTIAPFAQVPGLQVLDLDTFEWVCPEAAGTNGAVVMAGETLEFALGGRIAATTHRVNGSADTRRSCPYLMHARKDAYLPRFTDRNEDRLPPPITADAFVKLSQSRKESAVYS